MMRPSVPSPTGTTLNGVWAVGAGDGWAVGNAGTLLRWNGSTWQPQPALGSQNLLAVFGSAANDVYAVGETGTIFRFDGVSWMPENSHTTDTLYGVWTAGGTAWAVGGNEFETGGSTIVMRQGGTWTVVDPGSVLRLRAVSGLPSGEVWVAGSFGTILHKP